MDKTELIELLNELEEVSQKSIDEAKNKGLTTKYNYYTGYYNGVLDCVKTIKTAMGVEK
jgi:hypothetical protein